MTRNELLLTILGEECAEVHQRCAKALRFGMDEIQIGQPYTNGGRILQELDDLIAVAEMVFKCPIQNILSRPAIEAKKVKVEKYLIYSGQCGKLSEINDQNK